MTARPAHHHLVTLLQALYCDSLLNVLGLIQGNETSLGQAVDGLTAVEKEILMSRLAALRACLQPGFTPLVWASLTIPAFVQAAEKVRCGSCLVQSRHWISCHPPTQAPAAHKPALCLKSPWVNGNIQGIYMFLILISDAVNSTLKRTTSDHARTTFLGLQGSLLKGMSSFLPRFLSPTAETLTVCRQSMSSSWWWPKSARAAPPSRRALLRSQRPRSARHCWMTRMRRCRRWLTCWIGFTSTRARCSHPPFGWLRQLPDAPWPLSCMMGIPDAFLDISTKE